MILQDWSRKRILLENKKGVNSDITIELQQSDSTTGMTNAIAGTYDIGMASRELKDEEKESARQDMQKMLDYVDKLNELDTSKVEPMTHIFEMGNVFREDEVTNGDDRDAMLANAPEVKEGQYKVPKTVE